MIYSRNIFQKKIPKKRKFHFFAPYAPKRDIAVCVQKILLFSLKPLYIHEAVFSTPTLLTTTVCNTTTIEHEIDRLQNDLALGSVDSL